MVKKCLILFLVILWMLFFAIAFSADKQDRQNEEVGISINAFEGAFIQLKEHWLFYDNHLATLKRAIWRLGMEMSAPPEPVLEGEEARDLELTKNYLGLVLNVVEPSRIEEIATQAIEAMVTKEVVIFGKCFSRVLNREKMGEAYLSSDEYIGDGLKMIFQDNQLLVLVTISGTPAYKAGIQTGDQVLKINDVSFADIKDRDDYRIRRKQIINEFKEGEEITYELLRNKIPITIKLRQEKIGIKKQRIFGRQEEKIGIITIKRFSPNVGERFLKTLDDFKKNNVQGLIIDLRNNSGGHLLEAAIIIKALSSQDFRIETRDGQIFETEDKDCDVQIQFQGPIVLLINADTASASEIVTACLRQQGAKIFFQVIKNKDFPSFVGKKTTFGKNFAQDIYILPNKTFLVYCSAWIKLNSGYTWPKGIEGDVYCSSEQDLWQKAKDYINEQIKIENPH